MKSRVTIPQTKLDAQLARVQALQRTMERLAAGLTPDASWRHHPIAWLKRHGRGNKPLV